MSGPAETAMAVMETEIDAWRTCILGIIDKLRERKARPDVERIFVMASRQPESADITRDGVERVLQQLVEERLVTPVEYKGSVSYRNAGSWRRRKELAGGRNSPATTQRIVSAVEAFQGGSFTAQVLHSRVQASTEGQTMSPTELSEALEREAAAGRLFRVGPGRFQLDLDGAKRQAALRRRKERMQVAKARARMAAAAATASATVAADSGTPALAGPLDLSSRRPAQLNRSTTTPETTVSCGSGSSDSAPEKSLTAASAGTGAAATDVCDFCLSPPAANRMGVPEQLLRCRDCSHKAHPSCMQYGPELAGRACRSPWQCSECKTCCVCSGSGQPDLMLICDSCDKGYHLSCHRPCVTERPATDAKWVCSRCGADNTSQRSQQQQQPKTTSSGCETQQQQPQTNELDASHWTIAQVRNWLQDEGFPLAAQAFVEQEIDGASLMLMKRMDVLTGLGLKLGPAVKVFEKISRLQCRCRTLLHVK